MLDRYTIQQIDRIEEKLNELLERTYFIMEEIRPDKIKEYKQKLKDLENEETNKKD